MKKKRPGVFRDGFKARLVHLVALKSCGWTWNGIAEFFANDVFLGRATGKDFNREWNMHGDDQMFFSEEVLRLTRAILSGEENIKSWIIPIPREFESVASVSAVSASGRPIRSCAASRTWAWWAGFRPMWFCGEAARLARVGGERWVVGC